MNNLNKYFIITKNRVAIGLKRLGFSLPKRSQENVNNAHLFEEVLAHIELAGVDCFLFYGTLLEYTRTKGRLSFADDFDFAVPNRFCKEALNRLAAVPGWQVKGFMHEKKKPIQISFLYKGVGVDFSLLQSGGSKVEHTYPDFRNSHAKIKFNGNSLLKLYSNAYTLTFSRDILFGREVNKTVRVPTDADTILTQIYDSEWRIIKKENYINYQNYKFHPAEITLVTQAASVDEVFSELDI